MAPLSPLVFWQPALLWTQLALQTAEMLWSAGQVIGHRTTRMALAGPHPNARDRREFTRMGTEKLQAAAAAATAAATGLPAVMLAMSGRGMAPWLGAWGEWARLGSATLQPVHAAATANARRLGRVKAAPRKARR